MTSRPDRKAKSPEPVAQSAGHSSATGSILSLLTTDQFNSLFSNIKSLKYRFKAEETVSQMLVYFSSFKNASFYCSKYSVAVQVGRDHKVVQKWIDRFISLGILKLVSKGKWRSNSIFSTSSVYIFTLHSQVLKIVCKVKEEIHNKIYPNLVKKPKEDFEMPCYEEEEEEEEETIGKKWAREESQYRAFLDWTINEPDETKVFIACIFREKSLKNIQIDSCPDTLKHLKKLAKRFKKRP